MCRYTTYKSPAMDGDESDVMQAKEKEREQEECSHSASCFFSSAVVILFFFILIGIHTQKSSYGSLCAQIPSPRVEFGVG